MKNYIQDGNVITVVSPSGGVSSGDFLIVGGLPGFAAHDAAEGAELELVTKGVFEIAKAGSLVITAGDKLYWVSANSHVNKTASGNTLIGSAAAAAESAATTVAIRLNGVTTP